ncbi:galactokinase [Shewanella sedimentimangrovi]|uniref:Galactokinase n=1 Tax=Shewanella sedimentimangrovi TaxID=2814293 RepID=A0ABX7QZX4_9GAMM|nr:galactokinase [Shewanella sedimentimangrovi]QSX36799.1 galactokinase [Shewanella sedimentimangrovi]
MSNPAQRATKLFVKTFGTKADALFQAPGRVILVGEHTDYNEGFVLAAAINSYTVIAAKRRDDQRFRAVSERFPGQIMEWQFGTEGDLNADEWVNYLKGFTQAMAFSGLQAKGLDLAVVSNVPMGAGLSSSAALEIAFGTALNDTSQLHLSPMAIAQLAQRGESRMLGYPCGIMDQMVSAMGETDCALVIDCLDLDSEALQIPDSLSLMIISSPLDPGAMATAYRQRREECQQAADFFGLDSLRHLEQAELESAKAKLDPTLFRRARHVVSENQRTQSAGRALERGDIRRLGMLMNQSHASLRDDFELSQPEIESLVQVMSEVIGERGGVRMTDGCCIVALVEHELTDAVVQAVEQQYRALTGGEPHIYLCAAATGAGRIDA